MLFQFMTNGICISGDTDNEAYWPTSQSVLIYITRRQEFPAAA